MTDRAARRDLSARWWRQPGHTLSRQGQPYTARPHRRLAEAGAGYRLESRSLGMLGPARPARGLPVTIAATAREMTAFLWPAVARLHRRRRVSSAPAAQCQGCSYGGIPVAVFFRYEVQPRAVLSSQGERLSCGFTPAVSSALKAMRATIRDSGIRVAYKLGNTRSFRTLKIRAGPAPVRLTFGRSSVLEVKERDAWKDNSLTGRCGPIPRRRWSAAQGCSTLST